MVKKPLDFSVRVRLHGKTIFFGPGVAQLLELVEQKNSLQNAAACMGMSYSKAWKIVGSAEEELGFSLTKRQAGGVGGGTSCLTEEGKEFVRRYRVFEKTVQASAHDLFHTLFVQE